MAKNKFGFETFEPTYTNDDNHQVNDAANMKEMFDSMNALSDKDFQSPLTQTLKTGGAQPRPFENANKKASGLLSAIGDLFRALSGL